MIDQVIVPDLDPLTLDSIFPTPGRNESCSCGSGIKYKKCCSDRDKGAWRVIAQLRREVEVVSALLPRFDRSEPELEP